MLIRSKLFLKCLVLCVTPLLVLALFNFLYGLRTTRSAVHDELAAGLHSVITELTEGLSRPERELALVARSEEMRNSLESKLESPDSPVDRSLSRSDLKTKLASLFGDQNHYVSLVIYDQSRQPVLRVSRKQGEDDSELVFQKQDFPLDQAKPDEQALKSPAGTVRSSLSIDSSGVCSTLTVPIWTSESRQSLLGFLVAQQNMDALFSEAAERWNLTESEARSTGPRDRMVVVLDSSGQVLYHPNHALLHQSVSDLMRYFEPVKQRMLAGQSGYQSFVSSTGAESEAAFRSFPALNASVSTTVNSQAALDAVRFAGWLGLGFSFLAGGGAALLLTRYLQRQARGIDRLKEGVAAIAKGELDRRIEVQSSVDMRPLADDVNLLTAQLRDQLSREAEAEQFQSFVRLSAMLTHDLKNAIEALSLIVGNMERHFDNEDFRVDAMKSLNIATQNLRTLVERLSNPVTTLSGEHKRPQPVDLIPLLRRAIKITAEPVRGTHKVETRLPDSLFAQIETERIGKVIDNLVLNALEAMASTSGTLTVEAGRTSEGQVFFTVADTGKGMSPEFIERRLYHPFATTKRRGVGLGLYTCREVVRANGGSIEVKSVEGAGTTFRVVLPSAEIKQSE